MNSSPARSLKNINWRNKFESVAFMLMFAVFTNIPVIIDWLKANTNLSDALLSVLAVVLGYFAHAFVMPTNTVTTTQETSILSPNS